MADVQLITPCLWFDGNAEEAARFYVSVFPDSQVGAITHFTKAGRDEHGQEPGKVLTVSFSLCGQSFVALNGGPDFKFNEAVSFQVMCDTQEEVDYYWSRLGEGGDVEKYACGWLQDRFGLCWQVVPRVLMQLLADPDADKAGRAMTAMMGMKKLEIAVLERSVGKSPSGGVVGC